MAPFTALPVECVVNILLFLTPTDIRRCREISRPLLTAIRESRELQYLLELDALGYAVPLKPLPSLSLDGKIRVLKEHFSKTGILEISPVSRINVGVAPMGSNYQFSRGVFARGGPTLDTTRRLAIYQPASQNKQTKEADYVLPDLGINAQSYRLDPDLDLLVLLEVDSNPIDPGTDVQMRFHLRSLATGLPHPLALVHTITGNFKFSSTYFEPAFQIVGRLLAISCHTSFRLDVISPPSLSIWDWTTGELVLSTDIVGRHFAFISEDTFIVPFDRRKWAGQDIVGSLEVYTISEGRVSHVASLHLPATPNRPCHSSSQILFTPPAPSSGFPATTPARIYEMGPKGHYTCLQLRAFNIQLMDAEMASGSLFIPSSTVLDVLRAKVPSNPTDRTRVHIPWEDWSTGTTWVNNRHARGNRSCVFGHRAALLVFRQELKAWEVLVYDLRRGAREEGVFGYMQRADEYLDGVFGEAGRPLIVASFLITPDVIPWDGRAGDNPPEIMLDDEHVFVFKVSSQFRIGAQMAIDLMIQEAPTNEESTIYVYTL